MFDRWDIVPGGAGRTSVFLPHDDDDPNEVIGGGELNFAATKALYLERYYKTTEVPDCTVFAFGNRSPYLAEHRYPSESEIMTATFVQEIKSETGHFPGVEVFKEERWKVEGSGTFQEVRNILEFALQENFDEVIMVSILLHMARIMPMMEKHLRDPRYTDLRDRIRPEVSEFVLMRAQPAHYTCDIWDIFGSQSYIRNLKREASALERLREGITQTTQLQPMAASKK